MSGGWGQQSGQPAVGGTFYKSSAAGTLAFTPTVAVDTFKVWYAQTPTSGTLSCNIDGGTASTVNTAVGSGEGSSTVTVSAGTLGLHTLNLSWQAGGLVYVQAIEGYNSAKNEMSIMNAGWSGSTAADWCASGHPWSPVGFLHTLAQDLTIICLGINEWRTGGSGATPAQYTTNMQAVINEAKLAGDVILVTPAPSAITDTTLAKQQTFIDAMVSLAATNGLALVDPWSRFVSYEVSNPLGYYGNALHPRDAGYADYARAVMNTILTP